MKAPQTAGNILLVWDRIGDYHTARFLALQKLRPEKVFISDLGASDGLYKWNNPLANHPGYRALSTTSVDQPDLWGRFRAFKKFVLEKKINVVGIAGYGRPEYNLMLLWCFWKGIKVVLFAESWYSGRPITDTLKGSYLSLVCSSFLVSGKKAFHHFSERLKITKPIEIGYSVVDNKHFASSSLPKKETILLCVARFSSEKNLIRLLDAFNNASIPDHWVLKLVGGGPQKKELEEKAKGNSRIIISDWLSYAQLPDLYAEASFFILPSTFEPWGLVVNEAMSAGLPISLSTQCGCEPDLLSPENGFSFDAENVESIKSVLEKIGKTSEEERDAMGTISRNIIADFSPETWASTFITLSEN